MASLEDHKLDAEELRKFISTSERPRVKEVLQRELITVEQELALLIHDDASHQSSSEEKPTEPKTTAGDVKKPKAYTKAITNFGWDQSDKFVKIYITLPGVEKLSKEKIVSKFTKKSIDVVVNELDGKNHQLKIPSLCHGIVSDESYVKVKTGNLVVIMKKEKEKEKWEDVYPKKEKPAKNFLGGTDDSMKDPEAGIMNMMKKMYEEGDDEMKRTINKAWYESRNKADMGGF